MNVESGSSPEQNRQFAPNLFVAGVSRGGTTTLNKALTAHPEITGGNAKEQWVYNVEDRYQSRNEIFVENFSSNQSSKYRIDCTPHYFSGNLLWKSRPGEAAIHERDSALSRIANESPASRFVVSLRHPIDRYISEYVMNRAKGKPDVMPSLSEHVSLNLRGRLAGHADYLYMSRFGTFLQALFELVDRRRVQVLFFEEWTRDVEGTLATLFDWLEIHRLETTETNPHENSGAKYRRKAQTSIGRFRDKKRQLIKSLRELDGELRGEIELVEKAVGFVPKHWKEWSPEYGAEKYLLAMRTARG
jgi:hypothetical protein